MKNRNRQRLRQLAGMILMLTCVLTFNGCGNKKTADALPSTESNTGQNTEQLEK